MRAVIYRACQGEHARCNVLPGLTVWVPVQAMEQVLRAGSGRWRLARPGVFSPTRSCAQGEAPLARFIEHVRELGDRLGPILYQLPPRWRLDLDRLHSFVALLPADLVHVFEFREPSWTCDAVLALLEAHGLGLCVHDMPGAHAPVRATGDIAYSAAPPPKRTLPIRDARHLARMAQRASLSQAWQ